MNKFASMILGLSLAFGGVAAFGRPQTDQPKAEKNAKNSKDKRNKSDSKSKNQKRKAEEPKAQ